MDFKIRRILKIICGVLLINMTACNFYGDLNLGKGFYYQTEPSFNSIVIPVDKDKPYSSQSSVIRNIELLGFNKSYILATSKRDDSTFFWIVEKNEQQIELGYDNFSNLKLSNVNTVDSTQFYNLSYKEQIDLKSKLVYQKKAGWK